ncbi:hypothetical protein HII31_07322 [Pseudocercospora fuligena]|uniref:HCP-like protein n=1 Tax=Pseudocercospora fuligena TaxID=685502 RepID=A0A8H6RHW9_9PEZI|nr:hypothetical protein HII31_07322 [Pseudocercospora fuligena]
MPGLKDLLKKKEKIAEETQQQERPSTDVPEFKFLRTTTNAQEIIEPPSYPGDQQQPEKTTPVKEKRRTLGFRNSSNGSYTKDPTALPAAADESSQQLPVRTRGERRLSARLHLHRNRSRSASGESSTNLPEDLPEAPEAVAARSRANTDPDEEKEVNEQREAKWEKRATLLAMNSPLKDGQIQTEKTQERTRSRSPSISDKTGDVNIQEAIRLHEAGDLARSTEMFGALANPKGANNALAQVLYGLALRHGWGVTIEPEKAIHYLQLAASNSASIEEQALASGMKKGGAAKGELVLAIFELANCFRHGWGVKKDAVAARQYYETAANLGDTDAMDEAAWCYLEGFGGEKNKVRTRFPFWLLCCIRQIRPNMSRNLFHVSARQILFYCI